MLKWTVLLCMSLLSVQVQLAETNYSYKYELEENKEPTVEGFSAKATTLYQKLNDASLNYKAFENALYGYTQLLSQNVLENTKILTIVDFGTSSKKERLYIIDMEKGEIIHKSLVSHGRNSGFDIPNKFSNTNGSYQSSLGFYLTGETYTGKHGYSLRLDGLEKGFNSNARERAIVIHKADYVSEKTAKALNRLGRSHGCPALPNDDNYEKTIKLIKGNSCFFIYSPKGNYLKNSKFTFKPVNS